MIDLFANFIKNLTDFGLERICHRYYSVYRGIVTDNADPERRGRVMVKVPNLMGEKVLATFAEPMGFTGAGPGKGDFRPPDVDDWVFVQFEMGDLNFPLYMGGWHAEEELDEDEFPHDDDDVPQATGTQNAYGHVFKFVTTEGKEQLYMSTPGGHYFILDDTDGAEGVFLIHKSGAQLNMNSDGSAMFVAKDGSVLSLDAKQGVATLTSRDGSTVVLADEVTISSSTGNAFLNLGDGTTTLTSEDDMILSTNSFTLNSGSIILDSKGAQLKLGGGLVALGAGPTELIDQTIQALQALVQAPYLVTTGTGPSSPLVPPASAQLLTVISLLTAIKGSLS